jgi:hypothetical protein
MMVDRGEWMERWSMDDGGWVAGWMMVEGVGEWIFVQG